jgi:protein-S-isoprenylcysteine O-methyltransferase Ste14
MLYLLRHLVSVLILPITATVLIPRWIARRYEVLLGWPSSRGEWAAAAAGSALLLVGLLLFAASLRMFFTFGRGTLAPWDPPRRLVVRGPYRYVRNPMISGVVLILFATALCLRSQPHAIWALLFLAINVVYFPLIEEPMLEEKFGNEYRTYKRNVRRFIPRVTPWRS